MHKVKKQMAVGAAWMIGFKVVQRSIGIVSTIILARLLVPEDFGLIAMAMVFVELIQLLRAFNFDIALIQNQKASDDHYNTVFTFNVIAAFVVAILIVYGAPYIAAFYGDERIEAVLYVISISVAISGFENVGVVAFRKQMEFNKEFWYLLGKKLIGVSFTLSLVFYFNNYWAIVCGIVAGQIGGVILSYIVHDFRPRFIFNKARELFSFSFWLFVNNLLMFGNRKFSNVILGKLQDATNLGYFNLAVEIAFIPTTQLVAPINRAIFPGYSKLNHDLSLLKTLYLDATAMIVLLSMPVALGIYAVSPVLVPVLLGDKWLSIVPLIEILSVAGLFFAMQSNSGYVYMAIGKPKLTAKLMALRFCLFIPSLYYLTIQDGILGSAYSVLYVSLIMFPLALAVVMWQLKISAYELLHRLVRAVIASILMCYIVIELNEYIKQSELMDNLFAILLVLVLAGAISYIICVALLWFIFGRPEGAEKSVFTLVARKLSFNLSKNGS